MQDGQWLIWILWAVFCVCRQLASCKWVWQVWHKNSLLTMPTDTWINYFSQCLDLSVVSPFCICQMLMGSWPERETIVSTSFLELLPYLILHVGCWYTGRKMIPQLNVCKQLRGCLLDARNSMSWLPYLHLASAVCVGFVSHFSLCYTCLPTCNADDSATI